MCVFFSLIEYKKGTKMGGYCGRFFLIKPKSLQKNAEFGENIVKTDKKNNRIHKPFDYRIAITFFFKDKEYRNWAPVPKSTS